MIEKFNGIFYLIVFLVHFIVFAVYAYQTVFATKKFLDKFGIDDTGAGMTRFFGSLFIGAVAMAIWVGFIRPDGLQGLSLIHISEPTRRTPISYAVFCLKKKN